MSTSAVYILDLKGKHLISRDYRGDIPHNVIDKFVKRVVKEEDEVSIKPVFEEGGYSFVHVKHSNLYCTWIHHHQIQYSHHSRAQSLL